MVLVGTDINAYYMARNFHEEYGISPYVVGRVPMLFTSLSEILKLVIVEDLLDEDIFVDSLVGLAKKIKEKKIILVGCNDEYVSLIIKNKEKLKDYFLFNYIDEGLVDKIVNKESFYREFRNLGLDFPRTYFYDVKGKNDLVEIEEYNFPIIIKPSNPIVYHSHSFEGQAKVYKLGSLDEVKRVILEIENSGYDDKLIIQEFIPGDDSMLFDSVVYCSQEGKVQLQSFGQIGLQEHTKTGIGNLTVVINGYNEFGNTLEIQEKLKRFIEKIGFKGICEFDLKYDVRDKKFKVFEINPRQARSSYYLTACGYNLAKYLVDDLIYHKDKDFVFIKEKVALSFVPSYVMKKYIKNKEYRKEVFRLKREGKLVNPLVYKKDNSLRRKGWLWIRDINYILKYRSDEWK